MTSASGNKGNNPYPYFFRQLQGYLKAQLELSDFESTHKETGRQQTLTKIQLTVSNTAPIVEDCPKIVFTGVGLYLPMAFLKGYATVGFQHLASY